MSTIPADLRYAQTHEWVRLQGLVATIGISDHAQAELTDVVFVELPEVGRELQSGEACAVVESVKTASDIYAPIGGKVVEINEAVVKDPSLVNSEPYAGGWFFKLELTTNDEFEGLLSAEAYQSQIGD